mgnify:CR=1 FL=1
MKTSLSPLPRFRLLVDEDLHIDIANFLKREGHDVVIVAKGTKNGSLYKMTIKTRRGLLTGDKDFLNRVLFPPIHTKGILVARIHPLFPANVIPVLKTLINESSPKRISGKLVILDPDGIHFKKSSDLG